MQKLNKLILLLLFCCVCLISCTKNPFAVRDSAEPQNSGGTYANPVSAELAVENLFYAYNERNLGNLTRTLVDSFLFTFDFLVLGQPVGANQWRLGEELLITNTIFQEADSIGLIWTTSPDQPDLETDSTARYYRRYELTVITNGSPPETTMYQGETILDLIETQATQWIVVRWEDRHLNDQSYSWADLKSLYHR